MSFESEDFEGLFWICVLVALMVVWLASCSSGTIDYDAPVDCDTAIETVYDAGATWYLVSPEYEISQEAALQLCNDTTVLMERDGCGRQWREYIDSVIAGNTDMWGS